jgi:hypothetical protein
MVPCLFTGFILSGTDLGSIWYFLTLTNTKNRIKFTTKVFALFAHRPVKIDNNFGFHCD